MSRMKYEYKTQFNGHKDLCCCHDCSTLREYARAEHKDAQIAELQAQLAEDKKVIDVIKTLTTTCPREETTLQCTKHKYKCGPCILEWARQQAKGE